jgi:hypothetical protein
VIRRAIAAFLAGALAGSRLGLSAAHHRGRLLAIAAYIQIALLGATVIASTAGLVPEGAGARYVLIVLLVLAMGLQNAIARRLGVPDLTTTVLTLTLTGIASDSILAGAAIQIPVVAWQLPRPCSSARRSAPVSSFTSASARSSRWRWRSSC